MSVEEKQVNKEMFEWLSSCALSLESGLRIIDGKAVFTVHNLDTFLSITQLVEPVGE